MVWNWRHAAEKGDVSLRSRVSVRAPIRNMQWSRNVWHRRISRIEGNWQLLPHPIIQQIGQADGSTNRAVVKWLRPNTGREDSREQRDQLLHRGRVIRESRHVGAELLEHTERILHRLGVNHKALPRAVDLFVADGKIMTSVEVKIL